MREKNFEVMTQKKTKKKKKNSKKKESRAIEENR